MKHEVVCQKMATAKRKVFDSGKQRATGSDIPIDSVLNARKERERIGGTFPRPKTSWREKHETFLNAVSPSKQTNYPCHADIPLSSVPKDYVNCDYCGRNFNEAAAERHIPFCKTQQEKRGPVKIQKIRSRQANPAVIRSETNDYHRLSNKPLNRDSKMRSTNNDSHPAIPERRLSISRRSVSSQRSNADPSGGNDRRKERSSSRNASSKSIEQISNALERERISSSDTYRVNSREKTSVLISRKSSRTRKGSGTEKIRKKEI